MKLAEIAERIDAELDGDGEVPISGICGLVEAGQGDLSFLANAKYSSLLEQTRASAVIVEKSWSGVSACPVLRVASPDKAMAQAAMLLGPATGPELAEGVHPSAVISPEAVVDASVRVGPFCIVEAGARIGAGTMMLGGCYVGRDAEIGSGCLMRVNAVVRERVKVGDRVVLHEGSVVGGDGFGNYMENGAWHKIPHIGTVEIGDDAEIGANTTVDRARFGATVIGKGVRIDNLVMIGHNVKVGDHSAMAAQVGISGSAEVGRYVMLGGQAGVAGHLEIGDAAVIGAQSGVHKNVPPKEMVSGSPAQPLRKAYEAHSNMNKMSEWKERVKELEKKLALLEKRLDGGE